jgi:dihydroneopterin aldolase
MAGFWRARWRAAVDISAMDILFLRDFRLELIIGVYEWERKVPQPVRLDLEIGLPNSKAGGTDNVADTIDYGAVAMRVKDYLHNAPQPITLVESVAEHVAAIVRNEFGSPWVKVSVTKFAIVPGIKELGITIERGSRL